MWSNDFFIMNTYLVDLYEDKLGKTLLGGGGLPSRPFPMGGECPITPLPVAIQKKNGLGVPQDYVL